RRPRRARAAGCWPAPRPDSVLPKGSSIRPCPGRPGCSLPGWVRFSAGCDGRVSATIDRQETETTMAGLRTYSATAAANTALFPEGMAPSAVNDGMRQVQADLRSWYQDAEWIDLGHA